jgi:hypothetical protein
MPKKKQTAEQKALARTKELEDMLIAVENALVRWCVAAGWDATRDDNLADLAENMRVRHLAEKGK